LEPAPFAKAIKQGFSDMSEAMDFIQDLVISRANIDDSLKLRLIHSPEMAPYAFLGALSHI